jgi:hypothetical protein
LRQKETGPVAASVTLAAEQGQYRPGEEITFTRTVSNLGNKPLSIAPFTTRSVSFYWLDIDPTKRVESIPDTSRVDRGLVEPVVVGAGKSHTEQTTGPAPSKPGTYLVFISTKLFDGTLLHSNVVQLKVVDGISAPETVSVTIQAERKEYRVRDEIKFTRVVANNGKTPVEIYSFTTMNSHILVHWSHANDPRKPVEFGAVFHSDGAAARKTVPPGESLTETTSVAGGIHGPGKPGAYLVFISSRLPGGGSLESNVVRIKIVDSGEPNKERP